MNWENKELDSMLDKVADLDLSFNLPSTRELLRSYLRYAYVLGKADGIRWEPEPPQKAP